MSLEDASFEVIATALRDPTLRLFNSAALSQLGCAAHATWPPAASVAIGFADYGFDLLHPVLRTQSGDRSRFQFLWNQTAFVAEAGRAHLDVTTISDFDGSALDDLVRQTILSGSRRALDQIYDAHANGGHRRVLNSSAHGTLMASIAAGSPVATFQSPAPDACLIGVHLALEEHDWKEQDAHGTPSWITWDVERQPVWDGWRSYDDQPQIINAVRYIYDRACRLGVDALVVNLSIGAWAGRHDGTSPVERAISELIATADVRFNAGQGPRTIVVAGAGNAGIDEGHWTGVTASGSSQTLDWVMQRNDPTQNKLEIWYDTTDEPIDLMLTLQDGSDLSLTPGRTHEIMSAGLRIGIAEHTVAQTQDRSCARLLLHPPLFGASLFDGANATCTFTLNLSSNVPTRIHAWIERDDGQAERSWLSPSHAEGSLCCIATAKGVLCVSGYDHHDGHGDDLPAAMPVSSLGPAPWTTGDAARVPHFAAPGNRIWGARSNSQGFAETTGTSAAVALTSGAIAHYLAREGAAARLPSTARKWSPRTGFGTFSLETSASEDTPA